MQFYVDGYKPGDPLIDAPHPAVAERSDGLPAEVDLLIVGCGPAGLVLAAQMANFPEIRTVIVDRRDGPLEVGQADGVAVRTVEIFQAFQLVPGQATFALLMVSARRMTLRRLGSVTCRFRQAM